MLRTIAATGKVEIVRNGASMRCRKPVQAMPVSRISRRSGNLKVGRELVEVLEVD